MCNIEKISFHRNLIILFFQYESRNKIMRNGILVIYCSLKEHTFIILWFLRLRNSGVGWLGGSGTRACNEVADKML